MLYVKARFPINEISCLKTLLYWSEITSIGIHHIQCRSSFDSWFFSSYMMLENIHTNLQHFDIKQKINQWILKLFISGSHFAKDPVSVWAFDNKQLVFETGFENRIQFRCNQTRLINVEIQFDVDVANAVAIHFTNEVLPALWMEVYPFYFNQSKSLWNIEIKLLNHLFFSIAIIFSYIRK